MRPALLTALALAAGLGLGWLARAAAAPEPAPPRPPAGGVAANEAPALDSLEASVQRLRGRFETLRETTSDEESALRRPRTPSYRAHLAAADSLGVPPLRSEADLAGHLRAGRLVPLVDNEFYVVRILEHSKPFVRPALRERLAELGRRFQARLAAHGLPRYRFTVSSALRTADLQEALGQTNRNATSGTSSHEYGASADVVYTRFALQPSAADTLALAAGDPERERAQRLASRWAHDLAGTYDDRLFGALTRVLGEMQREGRLLVLLENEQPVFHLTIDEP
ncbi:DUF5715 family protein [Rubrivirga sp. S365]|uniref:DUF5715 family protein n=1 Tax=Rubrivirga litoralis TaxID=3075598 RepID=A0ABU3BVB1_9BACT|nr:MULTISPECIES: DUF5715 family protein [unclassified Rubrivirga]MDT0633220.1 DUF5715 family protein [Rubrivirga sp. F394]MDT7856351.1 DUF5715 family protein [Rubrivirga sp. S365]